MPRPAFLLCSQSFSIDENTKHISFFNLVEAFTVTPLKVDGHGNVEAELAKGTAPFSISVSAAWMREEDDRDDDVFEAKLTCRHTNGQLVFETAVHEFSFTFPFHRLNARNLRLVGFPDVGVYLVEAFIRKRGQIDWHNHQPFPFLVRLQDSTKGETTQPSGPQPAPAANPPPTPSRD